MIDVLTWQDIPKKLRDKISASVKRGAKLLDKERPGWYDQIDEGRLDMQDACKCIYGQLHAVDVFMDRLRAHSSRSANNDQWYYGYDLPGDYWLDGQTWNVEVPRNRIVWKWLQEEWLRAIHERREADKLVVATDGG
jgi:hypothetical protein